MVTSVSGQLTQTGAGTVVVSQSGSGALTFSQSWALTNGILGDWAVQESGSNTSGDYLKLSGTGPYTLATAPTQALSALHRVRLS